jgi:hypothetical protein
MNMFEKSIELGLGKVTYDKIDNKDLEDFPTKEYKDGSIYKGQW